MGSPLDQYNDDDLFKGYTGKIPVEKEVETIEFDEELDVLIDFEEGTPAGA